MIQLIDREEVFFKSWLVDHYIGDLQKSRYEQYGYTGYASMQKEDPYDHMEPFHDNREILDDFAVFGYLEKLKPDYLTHRSTAFIRFFELTGVRQFYLMDELKCDWVKFPFSYREKREAFKSIVNQDTYFEAFQLDITDLSTILPLFHFSGRHSTPIIWFFSVDSEITLAMFLCDDANFHTSFFSKDREQITSAASAAGLMMGGLEICRI